MIVSHYEDAVAVHNRLQGFCTVSAGTFKRGQCSHSLTMHLAFPMKRLGYV